MTLTREQRQKIILDYLCYNQAGQWARGEDSLGNSTEIQWIGGREEWQIIKRYNGQTDIDYEWGGCEKAVGNLEDEVLDDMISNIYDEDDLAEMFEDQEIVAKTVNNDG